MYIIQKQSNEKEAIKGTVVTFNIENGTGFVRPENTTLPDVFIHHKNIEPNIKGFKKLAIGDTVSFYLEIEERGPTAKNIIIIKSIYKNSIDDSIGNR